MGMTPYQLTPREFEILEHLTHGECDKTIGVHLGIATWTVKDHCFNLCQKMHVTSRLQAVVKAFREGLVTVETKS